MWSDLGFTTVEDGFANSATYDSLGRTISQAVNVDGNYNAYAYVNFTFPMMSRMLELSPNLNFNFSNNTNYINGIKNRTQQSGSTAGLNVRLHIDTLEFSVGADYSYNSTSSTLNTLSDQSYTSHSYNSSLSLQLPLKMKIETDASYEINKRRTQGYNINYVL